MSKELENLKQDLLKEKDKQQQLSVWVRKNMEKRESVARKFVDNYHNEVKVLLPQAQETISGVIQPWFEELVSSGTYSEILDWSTAHEQTVSLSNTLLYYWPENALKELAESDEEKLSYARFALKHSTDKKIEQDFKSDFDWDQVWYAGFELFTNKRNKNDGVKIWRQPTIGMGFGFAMMRGRYDIFVDPNNIAASLKKISPEVWIKFGEQIESGEVWKTIKNSLKPKSTILETEDGNTFRERMRVVADKYLKERVWH